MDEVIEENNTQNELEEEVTLEEEASEEVTLNHQHSNPIEIMVSLEFDLIQYCIEDEDLIFEALETLFTYGTLWVTRVTIFRQ